MDIKDIIINKNKIMIIILGILATLLIIFFVILPVIKDIIQINDDFHRQKVTLEKLYLRGQSIRQAKEDYEKIKDEIKGLDNIFYQSGQELEFITAFEKIANQENVRQIINIKEDKQKSEEMGSHQTMRIELNLIGSFNNILAYFDQIQTMDSYFNIDQLKFYNPNAKAFSELTTFGTINKKYKKAQTGQNITVTISGLTYWK